ncbi:MAG: GDSL-type esterase/lipase family protein [Tepidisphaeraceae bacterium]
MSAKNRRPLVEALEGRNYAAASDGVLSVGTKLSSYRQSLYYGDGNSETAYSGVLLYVDADNVLNIRGTIGDDSVLIRRVSGGKIRIDTTAKTYSNDLTTAAADDAGILVSSVSKTYEISSSLFSSVRIDTGAGTDQLRVEGLTYNPSVYSVETSSVKQYEASDGQTPSDAIYNAKYDDDSYWAELAEEQRAAANKSRAATVFFGDSHAARFATVGRSTWNAKFPNALDLGIAGDTTRLMIRRVEEGLFDKLKPETLIVSVGTNNFNDPTTGGTDEQIYRGIITLVKLLREKLPDTRIILIGLGPRTDAGVTERILTLNSRLSRTAAANGFEFLDIYDRFTNVSDSSTLVDDTSHFTKRGYRVLGAMLQALLKSDDENA